VAVFLSVALSSRSLLSHRQNIIYYHVCLAQFTAAETQRSIS